MIALRATLVLLLAIGCAAAQMPKSFYNWWSTPVVRDLNLTAAQRQQVRQTVRDYRDRLVQIRTQVNAAEANLEDIFNHDPVDTQRANEGINQLVAARTDLTRTLSQLSLKLRTLLTEQQWQELQRRRPLKQGGRNSGGAPE